MPRYQTLLHISIRRDLHIEPFHKLALVSTEACLGATTVDFSFSNATVGACTGSHALRVMLYCCEESF